MQPPIPAAAYRFVLALSLLGMLARVTIVSFGSLRIDLAVAVIFVAAAWWIVSDWAVGLPALGMAVILGLAGAALPFWLDLTIFVCAGAAGAVLAALSPGYEGGSNPVSPRGRG